MPNSDFSAHRIPTLSIVTVAAFETDRLVRTLESVKGIKGSTEHILVIPEFDKVSTRLVLEYSKNVSFPVLIANDHGTGIYHAMNIGIQVSGGRYCLFLNAGDEVFDQEQFESNILSLSKNKPKWAILGCYLPWNHSYKTTPGMARRFLRQEENSYVSHQSVVVDRGVLNRLNGFDTKFKIAADTLITMRLANMSIPLCLEGIAIKVERGNTVTDSNRLSRFETFRAVTKLKLNRDKFIAMLNILKKEFKFLIRKLVK